MEYKNLSEMFLHRAKSLAKKPAQLIKDGKQWIEISYEDMAQNIESLSAGLMDLGLEQGDTIGIFSENRPEWAIADFAILNIQAVSVPIYATNTSSQAAFIAKDCDMKCIFVGDKEHYDKVKEFQKEVPSLKYIICFSSRFTEGDKNSYSYKSLLERGKEGLNSSRITLKKRDDSRELLATLIYTSGTTGEPKGVMLSHSNFFHQFRAIDADFNISDRDRSLCFLPLSHVYERTWSYYIFRCGAQNFYLPDPKRIIEYLKDVRPTVMVSVPRLYEKIYAGIKDRLETASKFKRRLFSWSLQVGEKYYTKEYKQGFIGPWLKVKHRIADKLVLSKIRDVVGGPKNFFSSGGAPLSRVIEEFFFACGILICQGYGLTETSPMVTNNNAQNFKFGTIGKPVPECQVKISNEGEILVKGENVMLGYYKRPQETADAFDGQWLKTGDIGTIDSEGYIRITDRKKDIIITSGGKNIAPQRVETIIGQDHYIEQIAVVGNNRQYVSALIIPAFEALEEYARKNNLQFSSHADLISLPEIISFYGGRIENHSLELANFEQVKKFTLLAEPFTIDGGEITPTLKIKRSVVEKKYADLIDSMYVV